jgi:uncharacterized membrane protein YqjE
MVESQSARPASASDQSLGDLVALAVKDLSKLVRSEIDLAKLELRDDLKRAGIAGGMLALAAFVGCLVLVMLSFAYAYGLITVGIWPWAAFLIVAGTYVLVAAMAVGFGTLKVRRMSGLRRTRKSVQENLALIHRDEEPTGAPAVEAR